LDFLLPPAENGHWIFVQEDARFLDPGRTHIVATNYGGYVLFYNMNTGDASTGQLLDDGTLGIYHIRTITTPSQFANLGSSEHVLVVPAGQTWVLVYSQHSGFAKLVDVGELVTVHEWVNYFPKALRMAGSSTGLVMLIPPDGKGTQSIGFTADNATVQFTSLINAICELRGDIEIDMDWTDAIDIGALEP
jgi:hypothetical protein